MNEIQGTIVEKYARLWDCTKKFKRSNLGP